MNAAVKQCCDRMTEAISTECEQHPNRWDRPDALLGYWPRHGEYGLIVHDGGEPMVVIDYCPFCGVRLAESQRLT